MNNIKKCLLVASMGLLFGCTDSIRAGSTKTEIASFSSDENQSLKAPYHRLAVMTVNTDDLIRKQSLEEGFCQEIAPTPCVSMLSIFPPFRNYTDKEGLSRLGAEGIDAVLVVSVSLDRSNPNSKGMDSYEVEKSASGNKEIKVIKNASANAWISQTQTQKEKTNESQTQLLPAKTRRSEGKVLLVDLQSGSPAWGGAFQTQGDGNIDSKDFAKSEARPLIAAMRKAGLLGEKKRILNTKPSSEALHWMEGSSEKSKPQVEPKKTKVKPAPSADDFVI